MGICALGKRHSIEGMISTKVRVRGRYAKLLDELKEDGEITTYTEAFIRGLDLLEKDWLEKKEQEVRLRRALELEEKI